MGRDEALLGDTLNELERVEAQAIREAVSLGGGLAELVGGAVCVAHPTAQIFELNRAVPIGEQVDVGAVAEWFGAIAHVVNVTPERPTLAAELAAHGYTEGHAWMKFERDASPPRAVATDLRVAETLDRAAFALASGEGSGIPAGVAHELSAVVGAPGWHCFVAHEGDEPAASGALYVDGAFGWLGIGATRPPFRRRGAQSALLAARIARAVELGAVRLTTETGALTADGPGQSYRNILNAGFREAYVRANWRSRA